MRSKSRLGLGTVLLTLAVFAAAPVRALEADLAWSQEEVTSLAQKLRTATEGLFEEAQSQERNWRGPLSSRNFLLLQDIRQFGRMVNKLAEELERGQSQAETQLLFERMHGLVLRARINRQDAPMLTKLQDQLDQTRPLVDELAAYYSKTPPPVAAEPKQEGSDAPPSD